MSNDLRGTLSERMVAEDLDYTVTMPLDEGDSIVSHQVTNKANGFTVKDMARSEQVATVFFAGGEQGQNEEIVNMTAAAEARTFQRALTYKIQ